jgi:DNA modification methylase
MFPINEIITGDCRELALGIPDDSIDFVMSDPPYADDSMWCWEWLARESARVLKPGGFMFSYTGKRRINEVYRAFDQHLEYWWTIAGFQPDNNQKHWARAVIEAWRPVLVYLKPPAPKRPPTLLDAVRMNRDKRYHEWGQGEDFAMRYINLWTQPGDLVWEPFTGGGTIPAVCKQLGRNFVAFEVDPTTADRARKRLEQTPEPLFVLSHEQLDFGALATVGE